MGSPNHLDSKTPMALMERCTYVVNSLVSFPESAPFVESTYDMDFVTLERQLYSDQYDTYDDFEHDLALIWTCAMDAHPTDHPIYKNALGLQHHYEQMDQGAAMPVDIGPTSHSPCGIKENSSFYMTVTEVADQTDLLYRKWNAPLLRMLDHPPTSPYPRLYSKNKRKLKKASRGTLAVLWNTSITNGKLITNITLVQPLGSVHDIQDTGAWVKLNPHTFTTYRQIQWDMLDDFDRYLSHAYTTQRIDTNKFKSWIDCLEKATVEEDRTMANYREHTAVLFDALKQFAQTKAVPIVNVNTYLARTTVYANAEGYFKQVRYVNNNSEVVVQTFRRMTTSQRLTELVGLLKLKGMAHMAEIKEVLETETDITGLSMRRYERTLKQYTHAHTHHRLTAHQKMDLIKQMLTSLQVLHRHGIAHRDLSEVNFMVDEAPDKILADGSVGAHVYLIDFGKAVFTKPEDVRRWWIAPLPGGDDYEGEVIPKTQVELDRWCAHLPWIYVKPDHGYRCYRSIQTLPRSRTDHAVLPWLVDPLAEDMYSIGALIWKVFAETEPWHGILDSDLKGLRERVEDDDRITTQIAKEINGDVSQQLVLLCLKTQPQDRCTATDLLAWVDAHTPQLLDEWALHAPTQRKKRHKKSSNRFEDEQARLQQQALTRRLGKRQKQKMEEKRRKIEDKEAARVERQRQKEQDRVRKIQLEQWQRQPPPPPPPPPPSFWYPPGYYGFPPFAQPGSLYYTQPMPPSNYIPPPPPPLPQQIRFRTPLTTDPTPHHLQHQYLPPHPPPLPSPTSPRKPTASPKKIKKTTYVKTGRPVGRPRGSTKKKKTEEESASEFEP